jgi:hypothetical protein
MPANIDKLKQLIENIRTIGFWSRLFGWRHVKDQLVDAATDLERLLTMHENDERRVGILEQANGDLTKDLNRAKGDLIQKQAEVDRLTLSAAADATKVLSLNSDLSSVRSTLKSEQEKNTASSIELAALKMDLEKTRQGLSTAKEALTQFQAEDQNRKQQHTEQMTILKQYQDGVQADRAQELQARHAAEIARLEKMKDTWVHHQATVKQEIKKICSRHTIDYVEKVPFRGDPDNTVSICGEFIVFDAKSPKGEDLSNFPNYIKDQSEKAKKYASEENVKKWIFFVVPLNALEVLQTFVYHLGDYQVYVITVDALEPILLSLKKIEEYETLKQLSPEERENICRILGKFAHLSKRRIQIDTFFINQFMELAYKSENDLPPDVLDKAMEFERAERLNPPLEKRAKAISTAELEKSLTKVRSDAANKGISLENGRLTEGLNEIPLYSAE